MVTQENRSSSAILLSSAFFTTTNKIERGKFVVSTIKRCTCGIEWKQEQILIISVYCENWLLKLTMFTMAWITCPSVRGPSQICCEMWASSEVTGEWPFQVCLANEATWTRVVEKHSSQLWEFEAVVIHSMDHRVILYSEHLFACFRKSLIKPKREKYAERGFF